jgi:predicted type IV restriction endonuclease
MAAIPAKVKTRLQKEVRAFRKILVTAKDRDVNESDTVTIVTDMLERVFGFDKYSEVTSEVSIKGTFCDLAVKIDGNIEYLIEVKAIGLDLKENHLRQVTNYGANHGIPWVVLTNGVDWQLYKITFERPIGTEHLCSFDFTELNPRNAEDLDKLFLLCKSGMKKHAIEEFHNRVQSVNRYVIGAIVLSDKMIQGVRRELRRMSPGLKVEENEIAKILASGVLKREIQEGDKADKAKAQVKKTSNKKLRKRTKKAAESDT